MKANHHPRAWTERELQLLRELYPDRSTAAVSREMGARSVKAIDQKAHVLGLRKSANFRSADARRRVLVQSDGAFQKGTTPWNAGIKGRTGLHPNCRINQFKPGEIRGAAQTNWVPIGSLRISKDGYLEQKASDDYGISKARRWEAVHRLVWQAAHGPIPPGHIVVFRPGKKTAKLEEITMDCIECISRAEHAQRNHPRSKSPELGKLIQLKSAITRHVNRITREAAQHPSPITETGAPA